jgi:hypothetical protein
MSLQQYQGNTKKNKRKKERPVIIRKRENNRIAVVGPSLLVSLLNVNGLNYPIKSHGVLYTRDSLHI